MSEVQSFVLQQDFESAYVQATLGEVFKICTDAELPPLHVIESIKGVRASTGIISQPMKMFHSLIIIAEAQMNEIDDINYVVRLSYKWQHFDGGENGSQIATVFFMKDGTVKYRNYLSRYSQVIELEQ